MIHRVKGFGIVNKAEVDVFLELSCFFHDPVDVGNLTSGSSAFSLGQKIFYCKHCFPVPSIMTRGFSLSYKVVIIQTRHSTLHFFFFNCAAGHSGS